MQGISIRAVILASLAVLGVDIISGELLARMFGAPGLFSGAPEDEIRRAYQVLVQDVRYLSLGLILGTASTVLGGYLAARLAGTVPYFNAAAFGLLTLLVNSIGMGEVPLWLWIMGLLLTMPAALLGGHIAKQRMSRPVA
jgi:hypothetical protein